MPYFFRTAPIFRGPGQVETLLQLPSSTAGEIRHDGSGAEAGTGAAQGVPPPAANRAPSCLLSQKKLKQVLLLLYIYNET